MFRRSIMGAVVALLAIAVPAGAAEDQGAVYVLSNSAGANAVLAYDRAADGSLSYSDSYATGGLGLGAGLGSQSAVTLSENGRFLLAVNAGSNSISSFAVAHDGLELRDVEDSRGIRPTSVAERHGLVYVLNAGVPNSIAGFELDAKGELTPIAGSGRPLAAAQTTPSQIAISPSRDAIVVTERATSSIMTWALDNDGAPGAAQVFASGGNAPFGFAFGHQNTLVVSDAAAPSGASSYRLHGSDVETITPILPSSRAAACWTVVTKNGKFAYVANGGTGDVTGLAVAANGSISLLDPSGVSATVGGSATDVALSESSQFLFVRNGALAKVDAFAIAADGSLSHTGSVPGLPATAAGIAAS